MGRSHGRSSLLIAAIVVGAACGLPAVAHGASWVTVSGGTVLREPAATVALEGLVVRAADETASVGVDLTGPEPRVAFSARACEPAGGTWDVREVVHDDVGNVTRLWGWYEQRCVDAPPLAGEIRVGYPDGAEPFAAPAALRLPETGAAEPVEIVAGPDGLTVTATMLASTAAAAAQRGASGVEVTEDGCTGRTLAPGESCRVWLRAARLADAQLLVSTTAGAVAVPVEGGDAAPFTPPDEPDEPRPPANTNAAPAAPTAREPAALLASPAPELFAGVASRPSSRPSTSLPDICPTSRLATLSAPRGTNRADRLFGAPRAELIRARGGDDEVYAGPGDDCVDGGSGRDRLDGGAGHDVLVGGTGDDLLIGGPGRDLLVCGTGTDTAIAGSGDRTAACERVVRLRR